MILPPMEPPLRCGVIGERVTDKSDDVDEAVGGSTRSLRMRSPRVGDQPAIKTVGTTPNLRQRARLADAADTAGQP